MMLKFIARYWRVPVRRIWFSKIGHDLKYLLLVIWSTAESSSVLDVSSVNVFTKFSKFMGVSWRYQRFAFRGDHKNRQFVAFMTRKVVPLRTLTSGLLRLPTDFWTFNISENVDEQCVSRQAWNSLERWTMGTLYCILRGRCKYLNSFVALAELQWNQRWILIHGFCFNSYETETFDVLGPCLIMKQILETTFGRLH